MNVKSWISEKANYGIMYYPATIMFGYWGATVSNLSINTIIITCKFYILKCERFNRQLKLFKYKNYLTKIYNKQLMLARTEIYLNKFIKNYSILTATCGTWYLI